MQFRNGHYNYTLTLLLYISLPSCNDSPLCYYYFWLLSVNSFSVNFDEIADTDPLFSDTVLIDDSGVPGTEGASHTGRMWSSGVFMVTVNRKVFATTVYRVFNPRSLKIAIFYGVFWRSNGLSFPTSSLDNLANSLCPFSSISHS